MHTDNQKLYKFPAGKEGRDLAKTFLYRCIYLGPAYAYANDPRFMQVSSSEKFWQSILDITWEKYSGIHAWHTKIIQQVNETGQLQTPTGRIYEFKRTPRGNYSEHDITNYPVQGLGAEFVAVARVTMWHRYQTLPQHKLFKFVNTVHDSIVVDANVVSGSKDHIAVCCFLEDAVSDVPKNFERLFGVPVNVPMAGECKYGSNWGTLTKFKRSDWITGE